MDEFIATKKWRWLKIAYGLKLMYEIEQIIYTEQWKVVEGFEEYLASSEGNVINTNYDDVLSRGEKGVLCFRVSKIPSRLVVALTRSVILEVIS